MTLVVIAELPDQVNRDLSIEQRILGPQVSLRRVAFDGNVAALISACADAEYILTAYVPFTAQVISELANCKMISVAATGYTCIDIEAAAHFGISVCAIDEYCTDEVADHTLMLILALARRLMEYHDQVQHDKKWAYDSLTGLLRLRGQTLGLIGYGRVGHAVARRAVGFGLDVIAFDPFAGNNLANAGAVTLCDLDTLLATADIISLHCNLTTNNEHMINRDTIAKMRKHPMLINVARGGLIDEHALLDALEHGQISAAGLDVLASESPDLASSHLTGRNNIILTPHVAFYSDASMCDNRSISATNIRACMNDQHSAVRRYIHQAVRG